MTPSVRCFGQDSETFRDDRMLARNAGKTRIAPLTMIKFGQ